MNTIDEQRQAIGALLAACELAKKRLYEIRRHMQVDSQAEIDTIDRAIYSAKDVLEKARGESNA